MCEQESQPRNHVTNHGGSKNVHENVASDSVEGDDVPWVGRLGSGQVNCDVVAYSRHCFGHCYEL